MNRCENHDWLAKALPKRTVESVEFEDWHIMVMNFTDGTHLRLSCYLDAYPTEKPEKFILKLYGNYKTTV